MKNKRKPFCINVVILYLMHSRPDGDRVPLQSILRNLAWLYNMDYAIDSNTMRFDEALNESMTVTDLIHFRSGGNTRLSLQEFKKKLEVIFSRTSTLGVDVFCQNQVFTKRYAFPSEFYRPLNYPYVEHHNGNHKELMVYREVAPELKSHLN